MSRSEKRMLLAIGLLVIVLAVLESLIPEPTDWTPSYSKFHKKPYGGQFVHDRLLDLFPEVNNGSEPPYVVAEQRWAMDEGPINHIYLNNEFAPDQLNTDALLEMIEYGDHLFVAADHIYGPFADTLGVRLSYSFNVGNDTVDIRPVGEHKIVNGVFRFSRGFSIDHFTSYDTSRTRVLAVNGSADPVLIEMSWGEGRIVLSTTPLAFTNYNLLKNNNADYMAAAFSLLPYRPVLWDEYLKMGRMEARTPLRFILSQTALRWAFWITLALIILYMLTHARRRQRAIPIVRPLRNTTRELTTTIGRLYWHKGDHAGIARKMIMNFKEEVRQRTYLRNFTYDQATIEHLAGKTGLDRETIRQRLETLERHEKAASLTEQELLQLNNELHEFRGSIR